MKPTQAQELAWSIRRVTNQEDKKPEIKEADQLSQVMAEEFQVGGGNWWGSSRARFEGGTTLSSSSALSGMGSFGWPTEAVDLSFRASSSNFMNSVPVSVTSSSMLFQDTQKLAQDRNLQMMGLGLSSQPMDWNQTTPFRRGGKAETSFRLGLQQNMSSAASSAANFQQEIGLESWRQKLYSSNPEANEYKQFSPNISSSFQIDPAAYGRPSSTISTQGTVLGSENQQRPPNFLYPANCGLSYPGELSPSLSKPPQYTRNSPPNQQQNSPLQFSSSAVPLWNATSASMNDVRSSSFFPPPTFDEKPKNKSEVRDSDKVTKKSSSTEGSNKRSRSETPSTSPLPPFKVRKEKMGDRITALQQLVSPFGKTDTASVLSEAIEYIKFLHEQVNVLSNPYMRSGATMQHPQSFDKSKDCEGPKKNLRSRGLCLVPVSSTFPVTYQTPADFWTPTYGSTLR